jgi:hypothetical protein
MSVLCYDREYKRACKAAFSHHLAGSNPNQEETDMAEANRRVLQTAGQAQHAAIITLVRRVARKAVERQLHAQGRRLCDVENKEIETLAND